VIGAAAACIGAFVGMEGVSYAAHRWLMHGPGLVWHASHHAPAAGRVERNDLFPLCFSLLGFGMFALASAGVLPSWAWWAAVGITAYGVAYLVVHELVIHRRLPAPVPELRYLRWLRDAHRAHHVDGGEPFGMLLPLVPSGRRQLARSSVDDVLARASTRATRPRL
jgi:beta-carotene 3-hydroxylase